MVSFFLILGAFWAVSCEYLYYYCRDVFVCFWRLKVKTQKRPFLSILACYSFRKMANFATFQNHVILLILSVNFFHKTSLMCVYGHFLYYSWSPKFIPKVGHFWPFCLTTKWSFLPHFKMVSFFKNINCIFAVFPLKHHLRVLEVIFCMILIAFAKWTILPLCKLRLFFNIKCTCKPFSHRTSLHFRVFSKSCHFSNIWYFLESPLH